MLWLVSGLAEFGTAVYRSANEANRLEAMDNSRSVHAKVTNFMAKADACKVETKANCKKLALKPMPWMRKPAKAKTKSVEAKGNAATFKARLASL